MKNIKNYIRVGIEYFKEINQPLISKDYIKVHAKWNKPLLMIMVKKL